MSGPSRFQKPLPFWLRRIPWLRPNRRTVIDLGVVAWTALVPFIGSGPIPAALQVPRPVAVGGCPWSVPVDAPVLDPYREPSHPYGPGNRGIEYGVEGGEVVRAVAAGRVGFIGPVAGTWYVVVEHGASVRSTYGPVTELDVVRGQRVRSGERLATALVGLHLTARSGGAYVDPQPLIDGACGRPRLVPLP